jgi:antiviral helicase SKI2
MARPRELGSIIHQILSPTPENAEELLGEIGLGAIPSREHVHQEIDAKLLSPPDTLPDHWLSTYQIHWKPEPHIPSLLSFEPAPPPTSLSFVRTGLDGRVTGYAETPNPRVATALTSTSMDRAPGPVGAFVRGKSGYVPFQPGGLDEVLLSSTQTGVSEETPKGLRTIPPGFSRSLRLAGEEPEDEALAALEESLPSANRELVSVLSTNFPQKSKSPKSSYVMVSRLQRWMNSFRLLDHIYGQRRRAALTVPRLSGAIGPM